MSTVEFGIFMEMRQKAEAFDEIVKYAMKYFKSVDTYDTSVRVKKYNDGEIRFFVDKDEKQAIEILEPFFMYLLSAVSGEEDDDETYDIGIKIFNDDKVVRFYGRNGVIYKAYAGQSETYNDQLQIYPYFLSISVL